MLMLMLLLMLLGTLLVVGTLCMLRMWMILGMEDLRRGVMAVQGPEGAGNELRRQGVQDVRLLELQSLQLGLDLLEGDAMEAGVFMADGYKVLPEFPEKNRPGRRWEIEELVNDAFV